MSLLPAHPTFGSIIASAVTVIAPAALFFFVLKRARRNVRTSAIAMLFGAIAFIPAELAERWLVGWSGLDEHARGHFDFASLLYAFFVAAPLEQGLKVAACYPIFRSRKSESPIERVAYAASAAIGFITIHNADFLLEQPFSFASHARALLAVPAHVFCAATWGYAMGRDPSRRYGGRAFNITWFFAMLFNGIYDHIVFGRTALAMLATIPILACMALITYVAARDVARRAEPEKARPAARSRFSLAPPSIGAVRAALRRTERPVMLTWIAAGALVTTGVLTCTIAGAVALGHRIGVDFAAIDRGDTSTTGVAPLLLLGSASLAAFPIAGYLVARASAARSVLEPAIAAAFSIAGCLVLLGLAAPVAVVFAIAFAPIAFGLACAGGWVGMSR